MLETFSYNEEHENITPSVSSIPWSIHTEHFLRWLLSKREKNYETATLQDLTYYKGVRLIKQYKVSEHTYREIENVLKNNGLHLTFV